MLLSVRGFKRHLAIADDFDALGAKLRRDTVRTACAHLTATPFDWNVYGTSRTSDGPGTPRIKKGLQVRVRVPVPA